MTQERHVNTPRIYPASHCQLTRTLTVSRPPSIEPHGFAFSVPSTSGTVSARKIAQPKKSKGQTAGMATTAHINNDPVEAEPQEDAEIVQAFAAMDLALLTEDVCYQLTQEERVRQVCRKDMTAILTKLLTKCNATGDTLNTETVVKILASHCEPKVWRETWEQCYDIDLYVDAMEQKQTDLEI